MHHGCCLTFVPYVKDRGAWQKLFHSDHLTPGTGSKTMSLPQEAVLKFSYKSYYYVILSWYDVSAT